MKKSKTFSIAISDLTEKQLYALVGHQDEEVNIEFKISNFILYGKLLDSTTTIQELLDNCSIKSDLLMSEEDDALNFDDEDNLDDEAIDTGYDPYWLNEDEN